MKEYTFKNLDGRDRLIQLLVDRYTSFYAPDVIAIIGNHGSGKSYVVYETINKLQEIPLFKEKKQVYIAQDEALVTYPPTNKIHLDSIEAGISLPLRWGISFDISSIISKKNNESQFNYLYNILQGRFNMDLIIILPKYSELSDKVKLLVELLLSNMQYLKSTFKHNMYFLLTDTNEACLGHFISARSIEKIVLEDYDEDDIFHYLEKRHGFVLDKNIIAEKLVQIKKTCASNLKLVEFLYSDLLEQNLNFFRALDTIVTYRVEQLKKHGIQRNINEFDMEDIILTSSLCLKKFGTHEISLITHKDNSSVQESLHLAYEQTILERDVSNFYEFSCLEVKTILRNQLTSTKKEKYLDFYNYYTLKEQDQYFLRAYYLWSYSQNMSDELFALLMLAYSEAFTFNNHVQIHKIDLILKENASHFYEDYKNITGFYNALRNTPQNIEVISHQYNEMQRDYFDFPLQAELARAFFHFMYRHYAPWNSLLQLTLQKLVQYAEEPLYLELSDYSTETVKIDETTIRLRIIYDIAPFILDTQNNRELFQKLYILSKQLTSEIQDSCVSKGLARYIENVFNRKAFLFVNQMQCSLYYDKAKKFFYKNRIWDEYCITLICEAGTNVVIQKYNDAIECCKKAKQLASEKQILIPQPQKLMNNVIIACFLKNEQIYSKKKCIQCAKKSIQKLRKNLCGIPCATEYVIITNICSLSLYVGDVNTYNIYKKYIERLMECRDISDADDEDIDDFYRYYFSWFEIYRAILLGAWQDAERIIKKIDGFVPTLFQQQEVFWDKKLSAVEKIIENRTFMDGYDFCKKLVPLKRRETELATFFFRGLMLSDLQYTSYD